MRLTNEFLGTASVSPDQSVTAGALGSWELVYTIGEYGIDDTGEIMVAWRSVSDWELPQLENPQMSGYTTGLTDGAAKLKLIIESRGNIRPWRNCLRVKVYDGFLKKGDKIRINFGETNQGGPGIRAQSFCETAHIFKVLVDPFGTGRFEEIPDSPSLRIVSGPTSDLQVIMPSIVSPGEKFEITLRCLDNWGNPSKDFSGKVQLDVVDEKGTYLSLSPVNIYPEDEGVKRISNLSLNNEGIYYIKVKEEIRELSEESNRCLCCEKSPYRLYWGDLHGQNNTTIGIGSLEEYFEFARRVGALDFCSWQGNDFQITDENWEEVKKNIKKYNHPGKFITFLGYEWSGLTAGGGDHNIYFLNEEGPLYRSNQWLVNKGRCDDGTDKYPVSELWEAFSGREDVLAVPHIGGRYANLDYYNPEFIKLIEVHSHHGTFEWFIEEAIKRGLKVGFIAGSDDHTGRLGLSYPTERGSEGFVSFDVKSGYVAVYAEELTRQSIWQALKARRCYATTSQRIILDVKVNGHYMGEEITSDSNPEIIVKAVGTSPIQHLELYRGNEIIYSLPHGQVKKDNVKIAWSGVRVKTRSKKTIWDGNIFIDRGRIKAAKTFGFDRRDEGIILLSDQRLHFRSTTSGDLDGVELELDAPEDTEIVFQSCQVRFTLTLRDLLTGSAVIDAGGVNQKVKVFLAQEKEPDNKACISYRDQGVQKGINPYWVRVEQEDGNLAWSSPVYYNYQP